MADMKTMETAYKWIHDFPLGYFLIKRKFKLTTNSTSSFFNAPVGVTTCISVNGK